jgi:hypothetical protein
VAGDVAWYVTALHPASIVCALGLPAWRGCMRYLKREQPCFQGKYAIQDFANGLALPTFLALLFLPMVPELWYELDMHVLQLAGGIGGFHIIRELFAEW